MRFREYLLISYLFCFTLPTIGLAQTPPAEIAFVRQGVRRLIFDADQALPLAALHPEEIIGLNTMYPQHAYTTDRPEISTAQGQLCFRSETRTETSMWLGGFNPFATYVLELKESQGQGSIGFEFADSGKQKRFVVTVAVEDQKIRGAALKIIRAGEVLLQTSVLTDSLPGEGVPSEIILQMLGSGFGLFVRQEGLPVAIGQYDFSQGMDLREKRRIHAFQSSLYVEIEKGVVCISGARSELSTGLGQADIRAITYKDGSPLLDQGRLWYTLSIRGRALPHHIQGVFSMSPSVSDIRLEGVIVFDRGDGLLRNEISSHIFYDPDEKVWRGLTTGFSAYANPEKEKKQILTIESQQDPRFGFSVMQARPMGIVGDIEDSHILFDAEAQKWRVLTCENHEGYKAVMLESDTWDSGYSRLAGPVAENSTGTSIQAIGGVRYCFSGSSARQLFIYTYPDLQPAGTLHMDLPPWEETAGTRVWPNVVALPEGYAHPYVALMMDRYNYPGLKGRHWSYGALYLYYGYDP